MSSKKLYYFYLGSLGVLLIIFFATAYGLNKLMVSKSNHLSQLKAESATLDAKKTALTKAKKDIVKYAELEKIAKTIVPEDKSQAETVRQIVKIAQINSVSLGAISFPSSTLGGNNVSPNGTVNAPSAASKAKDKLSQLQPVKNIPKVYLLQITVTGDTSKPVSFSKFIDFLSALENNRRTAQINNITIQPDPNNKNNVNFSLTLNQYIKP